MSYSPYFLNAQAKGSVKGVASNFTNASGSSMVKGTPAAINTNSQLVTVDVSNEANVLAFVGLTNVIIPASATGGVQDTGRLEDVTFPSFNLGDPLWIGKDGNLTNAKPEIGVGGFVDGDFVVFVGVFVRNEFTSTLRDIKLAIELVGRL